MIFKIDLNNNITVTNSGLFYSIDKNLHNQIKDLIQKSIIDFNNIKITFEDLNGNIWPKEDSFYTFDINLLKKSTWNHYSMFH